MGVLAGGADAVCEAAHVGLARPEELGERAVGVQLIRLGEARHGVPVEPAHIFAPADDLADEALDRIQWRAPLAVFGLGGLAQFERVEQTDVQTGREHRVIEIVRPVDHRVLIGAEQREALGEEGLGGLQRLGAGNGPAEGFQIAEVIGEARAHQFDHLLRDAIGDEFGRKRRFHLRAPVLWRRLAVVGIEVPDAAGGSHVSFGIALHQEAGLAAHCAVEILHGEVLAVVREGAEIGVAGDQAGVWEEAHGAGQAALPFDQRLLHAPFARLGDAHFARVMALAGARYLAGEAAGVGGVVEAHVIDLPAFGAQFRSEMAHRREDQHDLLLVVTHIGRLVPYLHHQDRGLTGGEAFETGESEGELVAEDRHKNGAGHAQVTLEPPIGFVRRSCRDQYLRPPARPARSSRPRSSHAAPPAGSRCAWR